MLLVGVSLCMCLYSGKQKEVKAINMKWIIYIGILFFGNAGCSIVQKTQQMDFGGRYGNFFMFVGTGTAVGIVILFSLVCKKNISGKKVKGAWCFPVGAGVCNSVQNLCLIILATSNLSTSLIYPVLAVGSLIIITIFSGFIFKEKIAWWQWLGVVVGMLAAGLLSGG